MFMDWLGGCGGSGHGVRIFESVVAALEVAAGDGGGGGDFRHNSRHSLSS